MSLPILVTELTQMLTSVKSAAEPAILSYLNVTLSQSIFKDGEEAARVFCNKNGNFFRLNMTCDCDIGFFEERCQVTGAYVWGKGWTTLIVLFSIFYVISMIVSWVYLKRNLEKEHGSLWKKVKRLCVTPKFLVILNLVVITTTRMVYITVDPYKQKGIFDRPTDRVIHEMVFTTSFSIFVILLIVWMGLYTAFEKQRGSNYTKANKCYLIAKDVAIVLLFFFYPVQITFSYFRGLRNFDSDTMTYVLYGLLGFVLLFIGLFLYYTIKLKYLLSKSYERPLRNKAAKQSKITKSKFIEEKDVKVMVQSMKRNEAVNKVVRLILHPQRDEDSDEDDDLYFQEEMADIDIKIFQEADETEKKMNGIRRDRNTGIVKNEDVNMQVDSNVNGANFTVNAEVASRRVELSDIKESNSKSAVEEAKYKLVEGKVNNLLSGERNTNHYKQINNNNSNSNKVFNNLNHDFSSKANTKGNKQLSSQFKGVNNSITHPNEPNKLRKIELSSKDLSILNKIFGVSYIIIIAGTLIILFGIIFKTTRALKSQSGALVILYFSFFFEAVTIMCIFYLFIKEVQSKEYETLKVIGDFKNFLEDKQSSKALLNFKEIEETQIKTRIKQFINLPSQELHPI